MTTDGVVPPLQFTRTEVEQSIQCLSAVRYSEALLHFKPSTRVPLFAGEEVELVEGFLTYLDKHGGADIWVSRANRNFRDEGITTWNEDGS